MNLPNSIQEKVIGGYVLNDQGEWIPVSEKVRKERDFLSHLEAGEVLCNGKWVSIAEAIKIQKNSEDDIAEEMPVHYQDVIDNARTRAHMVTHNIETQENPAFYPPETVCIDTALLEETMPETKFFDSIPDSSMNANSVTFIKDSVNCAGIDNQPNSPVEIQNAISNINELISRKKTDALEGIEDNVINQALNIENEQKPDKKNRKLFILLIILGIAVCSGSAIIVFLSQ